MERLRMFQSGFSKWKYITFCPRWIWDLDWSSSGQTPIDQFNSIRDTIWVFRVELRHSRVHVHLTHICYLRISYMQIVNVVAYHTIALDFGLWSRVRKEIQCTHPEHFTTLLPTSKYKTFNIKQRLSSISLVRKFLFALQADWYSRDILVPQLEALKVAAKDVTQDQNWLQIMGGSEKLWRAR